MIRQHTGHTSPFPTAYIAAPFTTVATGDVSGRVDGLFEISDGHGVIAAGPYRSALLAVTRNLRRLGIHSILPHRDYNRWGHKVRAAEEVATLCTKGVVEADLFVGLLGHSLGSHYEYGIACGLAIPRLLIHCNEVGASFMAQGFRSEPGRVLTVSCSTLSDISGLFLTASVRDFFRRNGLL
jgi:hypothetical protein